MAQPPVQANPLTANQNQGAMQTPVNPFMPGQMNMPLAQNAAQGPAAAPTTPPPTDPHIIPQGSTSNPPPTSTGSGSSLPGSTRGSLPSTTTPPTADPNAWPTTVSVNYNGQNYNAPVNAQTLAQLGSVAGSLTDAQIQQLFSIFPSAWQDEMKNWEPAASIAYTKAFLAGGHMVIYDGQGMSGYEAAAKIRDQARTDLTNKRQAAANAASSKPPVSVPTNPPGGIG